MKRADVRRFVGRDWSAAQEAKVEYLAGQLKRSPRARARLSGAVQVDRPLPARLARALRREDYETHVRVKAVLDKVGRLPSR